MKILMIHDHFPNEEHGIYTHTHHLSNELLKRHEIEQLNVITPMMCKIDGKKDNYLDYPFSKYFYLPQQIKKKIDEIKPDIVHIHGTHPPYSLLPFILKKNYKVVITLHGIVAIDSKNSIKGRLFLKNYLYGFLEKTAIRKADRLIAVSPAIKNIVEKKGANPSKISVIPNGINISEHENIKKLRNLNHPSLFFIGRLVKQKGVDILIKSLPIIQESIQNIHLYIAGSGPQYKKLNILIEKLNLQNNVTFLGYIKGEEKISYYESIDICVIPSSFESFSFTTLEAMASGKPVVASNVGGIPYLVDDGDTGFLFEFGDYCELAKKIIELLENKKLSEEMGKLAKKKAERFSWSSITDETVKLYEKTLRE
ncbi:hypothetical protein EO98_04575 [Methanosarcina sp. 2.H.T.1A.6]|uniref:glycosyltransferase family 4 protein n=1 Tax=unclassified Methanosarcina TaxID=2644672 RepID=UPI00062240ED|nr:MULTISPECIES: glycosyltransferase family 4 protein [unclassified Methanosarcina]KKG15983.1 hypothetical protein EO94_05025 [Methanosarcina sp. 2.H.T.1A.3]KKG20395.1 hypothetical protein EO97_02975 [Methanosarcina sp. 2.H.T.1A.15]KKG21005.1 hypothetical protein EO96_06950 [Methanosarcina sp. 2.H.T.1A.8]KKG21262.1 hypothetical protein EO98_04575 [Methanosarcina sp. 2.H.T.1A.6]